MIETRTRQFVTFKGVRKSHWEYYKMFLIALVDYARGNDGAEMKYVRL